MALVAIDVCGPVAGVEPVFEKMVKTEPDANTRNRASFLLRHLREKK